MPQENQLNAFIKLYSSSNENDQSAYKHCGVLVAGFDGGRKGQSLDLGELFTLQTLRSTNQPGTLTACVWKFFTAGNFFTKKFVPNFAAPWHGWEFKKGKFPPLLSWISAQLVILLWQGNCPQFCILYFHWCQPPNPGFLPPAPSCSKVPPWKMFANKHLQVCFIQL